MAKHKKKHSGLTPLLTLALGKGVKVSSEVRDVVMPGTYHLDQLVHVKGSISVGEDYDVTPTTHVPLKASLALFVRYCGITRDAALVILQRAMTEALEAGEEHITELIDVDAAMKSVVGLMKTLPKTTSKGPVRCNITVETVETGRSVPNGMLFEV